ncbi:MAG TPA: response regulator transcription factor [Roseiflexaceae bacterium]|nr:response regulator transcription factor [Roseiflexaceae bacterium]
MTNPIRVLVVDDHLVVRRGLATLLLAFNDLQLVGEAQTGAEALALCATAQPDVVLMDLLMPEMDGVAATQAICERYPNIQVIMLSSCDEYDLIRRALAAGAEGYLSKNSSSDDLAVAIRMSQAGRARLAPTSVEDIAHPTWTPELPLTDHGSDLTDRERDVLALLTQGLTNTQIGARLIISRATVKVHVSSILSKFGAASRTEAVALAVQHHLTNGRADLPILQGQRSEEAEPAQPGRRPMLRLRAPVAGHGARPRPAGEHPPAQPSGRRAPAG